jgi:hypothetical protein
LILINANSTERLSWRLAEFSRASGLSLPFLRKQAREGKLPVRKVGGAVIVLDNDARAYLAGEGNSTSNQLGVKE